MCGLDVKSHDRARIDMVGVLVYVTEVFGTSGHGVAPRTIVFSVVGNVRRYVGNVFFWKRAINDRDC